MANTLTSKGQVTIPKPIRDALGLQAGSSVEFSVDRAGQIVLRRVGARHSGKRIKDRFETSRGRADVKWRTDDLMQLLRGDG